MAGGNGLRHHYAVTISWQGNTGTGTSAYADYARDYSVAAAGKATIAGSADPAFRGDPARWNPEELLLASVSACHQLWYLHLCADAGIRVLGYCDTAEATLQLERDGSGRFSGIVLRPEITLAEGSDEALADGLHGRAHDMCFIAGSVNCPIDVRPVFSTAS